MPLPRNKLAKVIARQNKQRLNPINHKKIITAKTSIVKGRETLVLPEKVLENDLPSVSILTVTRNRRQFFPIAIYNWSNFRYPKDKLEWVILDDSDDGKDVGTILPEDVRIKYIHLDKVYTIGEKRNMAVEKSSHNWLINMDDDDFHHSDEILSKILVMLKYRKECLISLTSSIYYLKENKSLLFENCVSEGLMAFSKKFWEKTHFGTGNLSEGNQFLYKREKDIVSLPEIYNGVLINHKSNVTMNSRVFKTKESGFQGNFYDLAFPVDFRKIVDNLRSEIYDTERPSKSDEKI